MFAMSRRWCCALALVTCFTLQWHRLEGRKIATCQSVCDSLGIPDGCNFSTETAPREEVIVVTNGSSEIQSWKWDTITMVVSEYFSSVRSTGLTACYAHSMGRRYGLREHVPSDITSLLNDTENVKNKFTYTIMTYQKLLMADHMVFDLLGFFHKLGEASPDVNRSAAVSKMAEVLANATQKVRDFHDKEVYCIVPWNPPCESDCSEVGALLSSCQVLVMSPDSYLPVATDEGTCKAQATVPISQFLYGIDRYISLKQRPDASSFIVAGIPWHGYEYRCDSFTNDRCVIKKKHKEVCFDNTNRRRRTLTDIHTSSLTASEIKMDVMSKGLYYKLNDSSQLWFENFTTLLIKYQLVQDLQLRGLSLWYGEDISIGLSVDNKVYAVKSWSFLTHHVLHKAIFAPRKVGHYYADTVAGVAVGCLLLGTILGVVFTCIGFRQSNLRKLNRPFKLDEDEDAFRDDEGL